MPDPILETERLVFHPFTPDDYPLLAELHADPEVQRYIGGAWTREAIQGRLDAYVAEQARYGFSKWKVFLRDGTFVGRCGVSLWSRNGGFEIGYSLRRAAWGQGLATEAAKAVRDRFWQLSDAGHLNGFTAVENLPSRRVLERIGMRHTGDEDLGLGGMSALYVLERP
ncbi:GNAT family N-acetyltransferase [Phenylobacterium sp. J367]|uniref:GNAT family N-acetyltransferase n=1 Tax=Phenylobacterium sp. J367 TaxID=2898435 RepID=UPI002150EA58|nr:GNAT family N-acetyltransferase [Phenylobacterium sp. J367]MCR5878028.1 GNAT family N-acetyltransferase [Phenylobacterium sp. J367]